jgi:two-component system sensor histidine kinase KdpD
MDAKRVSPEILLRQVMKEERQATRGVLKIFLGYASNVGKTFRMAEELERRKRRKEDVVVGVLGSCNSPRVLQILSGLEIIPPPPRARGGARP